MGSIPNQGHGPVQSTCRRQATNHGVSHINVSPSLPFTLKMEKYPRVRITTTSLISSLPSGEGEPEVTPGTAHPASRGQSPATSQSLRSRTHSPPRSSPEAWKDEEDKSVKHTLVTHVRNTCCYQYMCCSQQTQPGSVIGDLPSLKGPCPSTGWTTRSGSLEPWSRHFPAAPPPQLTLQAFTPRPSLGWIPTDCLSGGSIREGPRKEQSLTSTSQPPEPP